MVGDIINRRVFYVVGFADGAVMDMLNLMRFAAAPQAKRMAHITVRGPYTRRLPSDTIHRLSAMVEGAEVCLNGVGTFFRKGQNTVYLHCHSPALKAVWHKPQHSYTPHLTIYDGKSRAVAEDIVEVLTKADINLTCPSTAIREMISPTTTSELRPVIRAGLIKNMQGVDELANADWQRRLDVLTVAANGLSGL